jgi:hypothetical protein
MKSRWDSKVKDFQPFKIGDVVKMYNPQLATKNGELPNSHKLKSKWQGPYTVIDTAVHDNDAIYVLKDPTTLREWTVNVELLEEYFGDNFLQSQKRKQSHKNLTNSSKPPTTQRMVGRDGDGQSDQPGCENIGKQNEPNSIRTVPIAVTTHTANQSLPPSPDLRETEATKRTSIGSRTQRKAAEKGQNIRRLSEDASSRTPDKQESPSFKRLKWNMDMPKHKSHSRHTTGLTKQEQQRKHERNHLNQKYVTNAEALKEYELDEVLSHYKKDNQYRYIVSWQDKNIPHGDLSRNSFVTDEILWDYWNNSKLPKKSKPQEFRKERHR